MRIILAVNSWKPSKLPFTKCEPVRIPVNDFFSSKLSKNLSQKLDWIWITVHEYVPFSFDIAGSVRPTAVLLYSSRVGFLVSLFRVPDFILSFLFPLTFLIRVLREMHKHTHAHVLPLAFIIFLSISFKIFKQTNTSLPFKFITSVKAFFFKKNISSPGGVFVWWVLITIAIFFRLLFTVVQSFSFFACVYALFVCVFAAFFNAKKRFDCYYKFLFVCLLFFFFVCLLEKFNSFSYFGKMETHSCILIHGAW